MGTVRYVLVWLVSLALTIAWGTFALPDATFVLCSRHNLGYNETSCKLYP